jgi:3-oxoacyl-(acyl-carrier-protein) synthase
MNTQTSPPPTEATEATESMASMASMSSTQLAEQIMTLVSSGHLGAEAAAPLMRAVMKGPETPAATPVAVTGMACRLPGARTPGELWQRLTERHNAIRPFPPKRFDLVTGASPALAREYAGTRATLADDPRSYGSWLDDIEQFDPEAFGLSAFEAEFLGPAERQFLLTAREALESAGQPLGQLRGSRTGVFVGYTPEPAMEYLRLYDDPDERAFIGNIPAGLPYRLAYLADLRGPVLTVNTTCSSSLSAVHLAKRALERGECDRAVVAGVSLKLFPYWTNDPNHVVQSPRNRCAAFDASADGIIYGEGVVAVVLRRLEDAQADRDPVRAVITGTAMGSDGASNGVQAPNPAAQAQVIRDALAEAGVAADSIGYVEAHGAGTRLGDVVEVDALTRAFHEDTDARAFCRLGSIKTNLGHLGDAAGVAGLLQAVLCLEQRAFPGLNWLEEPNPAIEFDRTPFVVSAEGAAWPEPASGGPRRAGVSSFGISGTNVHAIVEEAPEPERTAETLPVRTLPVPLSAGTRRALWEYAAAVESWLRAHPSAALADVAHTLAARRSHGPARISVNAASTEELTDKLGRLLQVRAFERLPDTLFDQGIFIADADETRELSLAALKRPEHGPAAVDDAAAARREALAAYLAGEDPAAPALLTRTLPEGRALTLPVAPYTTSRVWPGTGTEARAEVDDLFFDIDWRPRPRPEADANAVRPGSTWVLFAGPGRQAQAVSHLAERLRALGAEPELVEVEGALDGPVLDALWDRVGAERLDRLGGIVHAVTCAPPDDAMDSLAGLARAQDEGVHSLFHLAQSLMRRQVTGPLRLAVVSGFTEPVLPGEAAVPARVTAFGFARVFSQEFPAVTDIAIDHDLTGTPEDIARDILGELTATPETRLSLVAYRGGERHTKVVERQTGHAADNENKEIPVRPGGTYLLAGGTGYLGMQIGHYLSERGAGTIVLLSRNGIPEDTAAEGADEAPLPPGSAGTAYRREWIARMEANGARVIALRCDLTDPDAIRAAFEQVRREAGPVHGAFMLAKQLYHLWIEELDIQRFRTGIDNRVRGAWLLARELRADQPDFLVLLSSISSLSGTKGASECCAVNQYLDAVGPLFSEAGVPTHTLNLTLVLDDKGSFDGRSPIPPIDFADFRGALDRFLRNGHPLDMVARLDLAEVGYLQPVLRIPFGPGVQAEAQAHLRALDNADEGSGSGSEEPALAPDQIRPALDVVWRKTLGDTPAHDAAGFFASGGTSLSALRFVSLIRKELPGLSFDVADLYGNPSLGSQASYLEAQLSGPADEAGGSGDTDDLEAILAGVESGSLSHLDAARLLEGGHRS